MDPAESRSRKNFIVRPALPGDLIYLQNAMLDLQQYLVSLDISERRLTCGENYAPMYTEDLLQKVTGGRGIIYVAEMSGGLLAGMGAGIVREKTPLERLGATVRLEGEILELYTNPELRGQGIGTELIQKLEQYFIAQGCDYLSISVFALNRSAHQLYQRLGYSERLITCGKTLARSQS